MFKNRWRRADKAPKQQQIQLSDQTLAVPKQDYFADDCHRTYSCVHCRAHLANHDELISKLFQGNHGRAYLFNKVVNIGCKLAVERELLTGLHAVADIYCDSCETTLGWKYEQAFVPSQKYKEGKYIIELVHMLKENNWDLTSNNADNLLREQNERKTSTCKQNISNSSSDKTNTTNRLNNINNKNLIADNDNSTNHSNNTDDNNFGIERPKQQPQQQKQQQQQQQQQQQRANESSIRIAASLETTNVKVYHDSSAATKNECDASDDIVVVVASVADLAITTTTPLSPSSSKPNHRTDFNGNSDSGLNNSPAPKPLPPKGSASNGTK